MKVGRWAYPYFTYLYRTYHTSNFKNQEGNQRNGVLGFAEEAQDNGNGGDGKYNTDEGGSINSSIK